MKKELYEQSHVRLLNRNKDFYGFLIRMRNLHVVNLLI